MTAEARMDADEHENLPSVSVIVPVFNRVDLLAICLKALERQSYPRDRLEVIVIDNGSTEDVGGVLTDHPSFTLLHEARRGSYAARNTGLRHAHGEVLAFTDGDCAPHPDWLVEGVAALREEPPAAMVAGAIELVFDGASPRTGPELYESVHAFRQEWYLVERHYGATANVLTWRSTIDRIGSFDDTLQSRGDAEWGQRVAAAGERQRYAPRAVVDHPARSTWAELWDKQLRVARGHRDVDLVRDPRVRHFAGVMKSHLGHLVAGPVTIWVDSPVDGRVATLRYLAVFLAIRVAYLRANLEGLLRVALHRPPRSAGGLAGSDGLS